MKSKKIITGPIPNILSLMPGEDTFDENWERMDGVWISDTHWDNINNALSENKSDVLMNIRNGIAESNTYGNGLDGGIWLATEDVVNIEDALSAKGKAQSKKNIPGSQSSSIKIQSSKEVTASIKLQKDTPNTEPVKVSHLATAKQGNSNKKTPAYLDPDSPENAWFDWQTRYR